MRVLVVGAGATGGYFGARLAQAGRDVTFLVRAARADQLRADGLQIVSPHGDLRLSPQVVTPQQLTQTYDAVILAVKAYALAGALDDVAPAVGSRTMLLPFLNGMRHIDALTKRFGESPVLGGVCLVSTQLDERGRIVQLSEMQQLTYGERDGSATPRLAALDALLRDAGFGAESSPRIMADMWQKWVGLATLGALTCLTRGNVGDVQAAPGGAALARAMLAETAAIAAASGYGLDAERLGGLQTLLTTPGSALASSMYRDLQQGHPVEADHIVGDLIGRGSQLGVPTPLLSAAFVHLCVYAARLDTAHAPAAAVAG